jgi:dTDP-4-amino-4,6-dideoxygalactose transaminase
MAACRRLRRWPILTDVDREAVDRVLTRGVLSGAAAPEMRALEHEFSQFLEVPFCLATNSGTSALHIALAAAGVRPGDEVIVPAVSFVATAQAVLHQGAVPIFADIDPKTYNVDPGEVAARITPRTRAIVPVHLHGLPADMNELLAIGADRGIVVIEDAAQAHGAVYHGRPVGTLGAMAAFSLNSTKNLAAGEGGLFVTASAEYHARAARTRFDGLEPPAVWDPEHPLDDEADGEATAAGWMYLPTELTCAIARSQLRSLKFTTIRAQVNAERLTARLAELPGVMPPDVPADRTHVYHKYRVRLDPESAGIALSPREARDTLLAELRARGVEAVLWQRVPLPSHPLFGSAEAYPNAAGLLDGSIVIGSQTYPLFAQPLDVVDAWADAFDSAWARLHS